jgi:lipopolysaccharide export system protein LptA
VTPRAALALAVVSAALAGLARPASAQQPAAPPGGPAPSGRCVLDFSENPASARFTSTKLPSGEYNSFFGGGIIGHCRGQNVTLVADSAEYYGDQKLLFLIGSVHYTEPRVKLDAQRATYFMNDEHLVGEGNVVAVLPSGTTMRGPRAEYWKIIPKVRPLTRMLATGRPAIDLVEADSAGRPQEPVHILADVVTMEADSLVYASGNVQITRPDITARGDSAFMDSAREFARLMRRPSVEGKRDRPFRLTGTVIDAFSRRRELQRVVAMGDGRAQSQDLDLTADTIDLRVTGRHLERAYAWGRSRAHASSPTQDILADSLDVIMPNQQVREVRALRNAIATGRPDSTRIQSTERDWLRGDTIIAYFDTAAAADTSHAPQIRQLVASRSARAYYQVPPSEKTSKRPAINYVRGGVITISFRNRQAQTVTVSNQAVGVYVEPAADTTGRRRTAGPATGGGAAARARP